MEFSTNSLCGFEGGLQFLASLVTGQLQSAHLLRKFYAPPSAAP